MGRHMDALKGQLLRRLIEAGTFQLREELLAGRDDSAVAVDDALADLVIEGKATFREGAGYRLAGSSAGRRAAQLALQHGKPAAVVTRQLGKEFRVGVLRPVPGHGAVMFELALPLREPGDGDLDHQMRQVGRVMRFTQQLNEEVHRG